MEVKAKARYIRMSPKKIRLVVDVIRGMDVEPALAQLKFINKAATKPVGKLVDSAVANAVNNFELKKENLFIKEIRVDDGPTLKRWMPKAFGRAGAIRKRSSHISIILQEKVESKKEHKAKKEKLAAPIKVEELADLAQLAEEKASVKNEEKKDSQEGVKKEIFDERGKGKHRHGAHSDKLREKGEGGVVKKMFQRKSG